MHGTRRIEPRQELVEAVVSAALLAVVAWRLGDGLEAAMRRLAQVLDRLDLDAARDGL